MVFWLPALVAVAGTMTASTLVGQLGKNRTISAIEERQEAERSLLEAEEAAREARVRADKVKRGFEPECYQLDEFDRAAAHAAEEMERWGVQLETELAEVASRVAQEVAENFAREVQERQDPSRRIELGVERLAAAKEEEEKAREAAERRIATEVAEALAQESLVEMACAAAEDVRKANEAKAEAEKRLREGIQPVVTPTPEELAAAKKRIQYEEGRCHIAIVGISGSGKSSLVNSFCGLHGRDPGAAATGVTETTHQSTRYPDPNPGSPLVWYDIPGAGTLRCSDWQYFNDQGLYIFDSIIVLLDNRFTLTDIAILTNARRFNIPTYIVRSKADQHIQNIMTMDMGLRYDDGRDEKDAARRSQMYKAARKQFIERTRKSVKSNLEAANLPNQRVYIVSSSTLLCTILNKILRNAIDEVDLLNDLLGEICRRRKASVVR